MSWVAEIIIQVFWEGAIEAGYRKWGWLGGIIAFVSPIAFGIAFVWELVRLTAR